MIASTVGRHRFWFTSVFVAVSVSLFWTCEQALAAWTIGTPIVSYFAGPQLTGASTQQMLDGGWNLVWANTISQLDFARERGLRVMWTGALDDAIVTQVRNHPALYAYFVADEPSAVDFPSLASTVTRLRNLDPNRLAYINLFPSYASNAQLGTSGYQSYLSQYMNTVHPSLLSYDNYQFYTGSDAPDYFKNLAIISHTAKQANIPFLNIIQACAWDPVIRVPSPNELRYLTFTTMAYGGQGISHFVYSAPGFTTGGGMVQADGTPTPLYNAAKTINPDFIAITRQVQSLHWIGAYHLGDLPWGFDTTDGSSPMRLPANSPFTINPAVPNSDYVPNAPVKGMLMGLFGAVDQLLSATYALVVNLNYTTTIQKTVTGPGNLSVFSSETGLWFPLDQPSSTLTLQPGGGALVALTSAIPPFTPPVWNVNAGGNWFATGNWSNFVVPNSIDGEARFYGAITAAHTIIADNQVIVSALRFNNSSSYVIGGTGTMTLLVSTGAATIDVQSGSHKLNLPLTFASNTNITVANGATLTIANPATIKAGKTVTKSGNVVISAPLKIETGGVLQIVAGATTLARAPALAVGAKVDLLSNSLTIDYGSEASPAAAISAQLISAFAGGTWFGSGIATSNATKSTGLGWTDDTASHIIIVKYAYYGDTDLNNVVDTVDFSILAASFSQPQRVWAQGDFNYDRSVDGVDLSLLVSNFGKPGLGHLQDSPVPDPASGATLALLGLHAAGRRCRNRE